MVASGTRLHGLMMWLLIGVAGWILKCTVLYSQLSQMLQSHTAKATQGCLKAKENNILPWSSHSPNLNPTLPAFSCWRQNWTQTEPHKRSRWRRLQWQRISLEETQHLEMSVGSRLQAVIECNRLSSKYEKTILMFTIMLVDAVTCEFLKMWGFVP